MTFFLKKWYLDCVDETGLAWIGYHVELRWMGCRFFHASSLSMGDLAVESTGTSALNPPTLSGTRLRWSEQEIDVEIEAQSLLPSVSREIVKSAEGNVVWNCVAPLTDARVRAGDKAIHGLGYAEVLEMTASPWALGIEDLRWGRFTADGASVVWIDCSGEHPIRLGCRDGSEVGLRSASETLVETSDGSKLSFARTSVVRDERLSVPFRRLGVLAWLIPKRVRDAREQKWLSRARLTDGELVTTEGWVIHERVSFA